MSQTSQQCRPAKGAIRLKGAITFILRNQELGLKSSSLFRPP